MSAQLERIIAEGTTRAVRTIDRRRGKPSSKITCADGFSLSVVAGEGTYCHPRPGMTAEDCFEGPYEEVEVGFPSERPQPWADWVEYCESPSDPTDTVYAYVPVALVRALVDLHGGAA